LREGEGSHFFDVRSGREDALAAGQNNSADFGMGFKFEEGSVEFVDERGIEGIERFEAVERYCVLVSRESCGESSTLLPTLTNAWSRLCDFYILIRPGYKSVRRPR
jgi:hypothetical protein